MKGRLVRPIKAGGDCVRVGDCLKYLKRGWNRKEGWGWGKLGLGVGALKTGLNPLPNYDNILFGSA